MQKVEHNEDQNKFIVPLGSEAAHLKYRFPKEGVIEYYSTFVPESGRGQGIAAILAEAGLTWAKSQSWKVIPTCWYIDKYMKKNSQWNILRAD